jgi:diguanylate cyclase (GGDEF)-like protein
MRGGARPDLHHCAIVIDADDETTAAVAVALPPTSADEVLHARTGREALELLGIGPRTRRGKTAPALIVVELDLADIDGFSLLRRLRAVRVLRDVPIVAIARSSDGEVIDVALDSGASDFVRKPLDRDELRARLRTCWAHARARNRWRRREQDLNDLVQQLEATNEELRRWTCVDPLTGIANRHQFDRVARVEWQRAVRDGRPMSAVMVDVDGFHGFNEAYGHQAGDRCLISVAGALATCLRRASDVFARYGGEEFVALLPDTDLRGASVVAERMRAAVERLAIESRAATGVVTISAGVASVVPRGGSSLEDLVAAADAALLEAKARGRNRVAGACDPDPADRPSPPYPWPQPVLVDPAWAGELPVVLRRHDEELSQVRAFDPPRIRAVARGMRSTATSLGLGALEQLAFQLDIAARCGDLEAIDRAKDELHWYLTRVHVVYRRPDTQPS